MSVRVDGALSSPRLLAQFADGGGAGPTIDPHDAVDHLTLAFELLPITDLVVGWRLPSLLVREITAFVRSRTRARLWLWHPLLTSDGSAPIADDDVVVGPLGEPVVDTIHDGLFTFACPNRPASYARSLARLDEDLQRVTVDGVFLDRIRWPSPAKRPSELLTCFCSTCHTIADTDGLDLELVSVELAGLSGTLTGRRQIVDALAGRETHGIIPSFMEWRAATITRAVAEGAAHVRHGQSRLPIALDVFSPSLAFMVGQDLAALAAGAEWIKAMIYTSVHAPAGMPYELVSLAQWLDEAGDPDSIPYLAGVFGYPIPPTDELRSKGLSCSVVSIEAERLQREVGAAAAAGIEAIIDREWATMDDSGLAECLQAATGVGLPIVISWDLAQVPEERLRIIASCLPKW